jgi:glycosyltransferase involved in cell wall biosynthesis
LEPDTNSGDLRLYEIIRILKEVGHHIIFMQPSSKINKLLCKLGIKNQFNTKIASRTPYLFKLYLLGHDFDVAILSPYHTYHNLAPIIKNTIPRCSLSLDTIALFHVRTQRLAELTSDPADIVFARQTNDAEWKCLKDADSVWVVTNTEKTLIDSSVKRVFVVPNFHRPAAEIRAYEEREGIVFLGGYAHKPNVDAVRYFIKEILSHIRKSLPGVPVIIAGSNPPDEFKRYESEFGLRVTGYIPDHRVILNSCRIGIAPLRYGAGMKGKIGEYLSCGLPCVTTSIGAEGMNFLEGVEVLIADDPVGFANKVITAYTDRVCWQQLSDSGIKYIQQNLSPHTLKGGVEEALCQVCGEKGQIHFSRISHVANRILSLARIVGRKIF